MKKIFSILICLCLTYNYSQAQIDSIKPYTAFLDKSHLTSTEYIISLFDKYDIVIFCERWHDELTQYELLVNVLSDKRFINKVGHIFTEMGGGNFDTRINTYLHKTNLSQKQSAQAAIEIQRDATWYPLWGRYNYHYLLTSLYNINKPLKKSEKLSLHPTDMSLNWNEVLTKDDVKKKIFDNMLLRDSIMAHNIIKVINSVKQSKENRQKFFIILNAGHSTPAEYSIPSQKNLGTIFKIKSAAKWLAEYYPNMLANVAVNMATIPRNFNINQISSVPFLNGKWDAAFYNEKLNDVGFDIKGSPLEGRLSELFPLSDTTLTYDQVYTGYVFYKHFPQQEFVNGVPGLIDNEYANELYRRNQVFYEEDKSPKEVVIKGYYWWYNTKRTELDENLISHWETIMHWLKKNDRK